jgi:energy-converting hydrogenase Eha subunit F
MPAQAWMDKEIRPTSLVNAATTLTVAKGIAENHLCEIGARWNGEWKGVYKNGIKYWTRKFDTVLDTGIMMILPGRVGGSDE